VRGIGLTGLHAGKGMGKRGGQRECDSGGGGEGGPSDVSKATGKSRKLVDKGNPLTKDRADKIRG